MMVRALIEVGADVNRAADDGLTPLFIAAKKGHEAVARVLIELKADLHYGRVDGFTTVDIAAQYGHWKIEEILRNAGAVAWDAGAA